MRYLLGRAGYARELLLLLSAPAYCSCFLILIAVIHSSDNFIAWSSIRK
jgi:hypothetical protein